MAIRCHYQAARVKGVTVQMGSGVRAVVSLYGEVQGIIAMVTGDTLGTDR